MPNVASAAALSTWSNEDSGGAGRIQRSIGTDLALVNTGPYFDVADEIAGLGGDHPDR